MFSWLCTFLPLSGCTESENENAQSPQRDEPLFSIQDVRSPLLTSENCLSGSQLQMVKTENLERYFCATKEGVLVGPCGTSPGVGLNPTTPHQLAGFLKLPPKSVPVANQAIPVASAAAEPPGPGHAVEASRCAPGR